MWLEKELVLKSAKVGHSVKPFTSVHSANQLHFKLSLFHIQGQVHSDLVREGAGAQKRQGGGQGARGGHQADCGGLPEGWKGKRVGRRITASGGGLA